MKRSTLLAISATLLATFVVAYAGHRYLWSCIWRARDITGLTLRGDVLVESCVNTFDNTDIVVALDSAATAQAAAEASRSVRHYIRVEDLPTASRPTNVTGKHGWYFSTFGKSSNSSLTIVFLDLSARRLTVKHAPF